MRFVSISSSASDAVHAVLQTLAGAGSDVAAVDTKGRNALMLAAKHNQPAAVEQLVGLHKLSCSSKDTSGATCLMHAAAGGAVQVVQLLLQQAAAWKVDILAADSEGSTAAAHAVKGGSVAVLETLLAWGVPLYWQPPGEQDQGVPPAVAAATAPAAAMAGVGTSQLAGYQVPGVGTGLQCPTGAGWEYVSPGSVQGTAVGAATSPGWGTVAPLQPPLPPPSAAAPAAAGGGGGMRAAGTTAAAGMGPAGPTAAAAAASSVGGNWTTTHSSRAASPTPGAPGVGLAGSSRREAADGRLLSAAARHGHPQVVEWLLSKGIGEQRAWTGGAGVGWG
jgi:ankyrin repeat protein